MGFVWCWHHLVHWTVDYLLSCTRRTGQSILAFQLYNNAESVVVELESVFELWPLSNQYPTLPIVVLPLSPPPIFVTGYDKRDHLGYFINNEILICIDNPFCVEYKGESFKRKEWSQAELWSFLCTWVLIDRFRKIANKFCKLYCEVHAWMTNYAS